MNYGFVNVAAAIPSVRVADVKYNMSEVTTLLFKAEAEGVEVVVFPRIVSHRLFLSRSLCPADPPCGC